MIDTAQGYPNSEPQVAEAIAQSGIPRSEIFIMTKLHPKYLGYDSTLEAIEMSLRALKTDYIDLFLIHSKHCDNFLLLCEEGNNSFVSSASFICSNAQQSLKCSRQDGHFCWNVILASSLSHNLSSRIVWPGKRIAEVATRM